MEPGRVSNGITHLRYLADTLLLGDLTHNAQGLPLMVCVCVCVCVRVRESAFRCLSSRARFFFSYVCYNYAHMPICCMCAYANRISSICVLPGCKHSLPIGRCAQFTFSENTEAEQPPSPPPPLPCATHTHNHTHTSKKKTPHTHSQTNTHNHTHARTHTHTHTVAVGVCVCVYLVPRAGLAVGVVRAWVLLTVVLGGASRRSPVLTART